MRFNIIKWVKNPSYAKNRVGTIKVMPESVAINLSKKGLLTILKDTDMVKCEVIKPILYSGKLQDKGTIIEVSYEKAERMSNNGDLKIVEFQKQTKDVATELQEQATEVRDVEQATSEAPASKKRNNSKKSE